MKHTLQNLRQTASQILAASIFETFPDVEIAEARATDTGFLCECYFPHSINPETLPLFEEKMRQIIREKRPIRTMEMVPESAIGLLEKEGHLAQCDLLEEMGGNLVEVIEMGTFHSLSEGPHLENTSQVGAFKLLSLESLPDHGIRIRGVAAASKEELKDFLKKLSAYQEKSHQVIGERLGLWKIGPEGWLWFEKGLRCRERLLNYFFTDSEWIVCVGDRGQIPLHRPCKEFLPHSQPVQNLCDSEAKVQKILSIQGDAAISCLHSVRKTLIILGFHCWTRIAGKRQGKSWKILEEAILKQADRIEKSEEAEAKIDLRVEDELGRSWSLASLRKEADLLYCEAYVERILALLLEMNIGISPFLIERPNQEVQH